MMKWPQVFWQLAGTLILAVAVGTAANAVCSTKPLAGSFVIGAFALSAATLAWRAAKAASDREDTKQEIREKITSEVLFNRVTAMIQESLSREIAMLSSTPIDFAHWRELKIRKVKDLYPLIDEISGLPTDTRESLIAAMRLADDYNLEITRMIRTPTSFDATKLRKMNHEVFQKAEATAAKMRPGQRTN